MNTALFYYIINYFLLQKLKVLDIDADDRRIRDFEASDLKLRLYIGTRNNYVFR